MPKKWSNTIEKVLLHTFFSQCLRSFNKKYLMKMKKKYSKYSTLLKILLFSIDFNIKMIKTNRFVYYENILYILIKFNDFSIEIY